MAGPIDQARPGREGRPGCWWAALAVHLALQVAVVAPVTLRTPTGDNDLTGVLPLVTPLPGSVVAVHVVDALAGGVGPSVSGSGYMLLLLVVSLAVDVGLALPAVRLVRRPR